MVGVKADVSIPTPHCNWTLTKLSWETNLNPILTQTKQNKTLKCQRQEGKKFTVSRTVQDIQDPVSKYENLTVNKTLFQQNKQESRK